MSSTAPIIAHPAGVSRTIFAISLIIVAIIATLSGYFAYGFTHPPSNAAPNETFNGAGATFPYPFLSAVSTNYSRIHPNIAINYNPIGSGGGVNALISKTVDFAASDAPLTSTQMNSAPNSLHIPETIGAVVVAYNLGKSFPTGLKLNANVTAKIFQGNITAWNDPAIVGLNPGLTLPSTTIQVVHRSDSSGTTFIFSSYLNATATGVWKLGAGKSLQWPGGIGASGNQGVAGVIQGSSNTIGYVELNYALSNSMSTSYILNKANVYVAPTLANVTYAVANATSVTGALPAGNGSWTSVNLLNAAGQDSYPIVSFTYVLVYKELNVLSGYDNTKATELVNFLWFIVHDGQAQAKPLAYVKLPASVVQVDEATLRSITFNGTTLHS